MRQFKRRTFDLYDEQQLAGWLRELGFDLSRPAALAEKIVDLSDLYNAGRGSPEVWADQGFLAAYLAYFHPLNYLRAQQVVAEGLAVGFWSGVNRFLDFGAGLGALGSAVHDRKDISLKAITAFEPAPAARAWAARLSGRSTEFTNMEIPADAQTVVGFSYSLNEMDRLPERALKAEGLLFLEPSTMTAGRALQALRGELIQKGYHAWAPCLHQLDCPLLKHSQKDWCHTRLHIDMPEWFTRLENLLPMKNHSITYSYLLLRRTPPPAHDAQTFRVIGDTLFEKGKTRQAVCRDDRRRYFAWLTKHGVAPSLPRGSLVRVMSTLTEKSDELRPEGGTFHYQMESDD